MTQGAAGFSGTTQRSLERLFLNANPRLTKTDRAHRTLRQAIVNGLLLPGAALHTEALARAFGMSRIPVREALRRLEQEGLVRIRAHSGASVREPTHNEVKENLVIRSELEALATRLACPLLDTDLLNKLQYLWEGMEAAAGRSDGESYRTQNREFHLLIYRANPYHRLVEFIEQLWVVLGEARSVFALNPDYMAQSQIEHWHLLEALRARDADGAADIIRSHKLNGMLAFERVLEMTNGPEDSDNEKIVRADSPVLSD